MTRAYDEMYLGTARKALANMLDHAVHQHDMEMKEFYDLFLVSSIAERFQSGDCSIIAGRSGAELVEMVLEESGMKRGAETSDISSEDGMLLHGKRSPEYWTGWSLAYYQWFADTPFKLIDRAVPIKEIRDMYPLYHEMDVLKFCDEMKRRTIAKRGTETRLKYYRMKLGLSQSQLAEAAGIPVRTIQQYEQRQKDINHARSECVLRLSKALHCSQQALME